MPAPRHRRVALAALTTALVVLSGCRGGDAPVPAASPTAPSASPTSPTATGTPSRAGGTLRFALSSDPSSIDPRFVVDDEGAVVADALFDSLVDLDDDLAVVPAAAESWEVSDDGRILTFALRDGATFHDGSPVTAADFVRTFTRIADGTAEPRSFLAFQLAPIEGFAEAQTSGGTLSGVEAVDDLTLRITLTEPFPEFLEVLARPSLAPTPPAADEDPEAFAESPIGNGPFQMAEPRQVNQFIRVARFGDHWDDPALLDTVVFRVYANDPAQETQFADFVGGQLQFAEVPASKREEAVQQFGLSTDGYTGPGVLDGLSTTIYYFGFNTEAPPFDDPEMRRAISLLIDREAIAAEIMRDTRVPADAIVPPSLPDHQADVCDHCRYDREDAAAIIQSLRDADEDFSVDQLTILHNTGTTHQAIAERVAGDISEVLGIEVTTRGEPLDGYVQTLRAGEMQIFRLGWQADHPSAGAYLYPLFSGDRKGTDNLTRYDVDEVDDLLARARASTSAEERTELWREAERRILADVAIAPVLYYRLDKVVAPEVRDLRLSPLGLVDLEDVWLDTAG